MTLTVYNTLTRNKSAFQTIEEHKVRMYCCGMTVYDYCHLGHARTCLVWDVVRRYLQWSGYEVNYIQNFTDIDDKILKRASEEGTSMEAVSEKYIAAYFEDMERLGVGQADAYPRATHTLDGIKRLVAELEQKGFAYPAEGDVDGLEVIGESVGLDVTGDVEGLGVAGESVGVQPGADPFRVWAVGHIGGHRHSFVEDNRRRPGKRMPAQRLRRRC
ncbi:MAG: hypothetical protein RLZZ69_2864, partial [Cyanobacteriota bacterium]